MMMTEEEKKIKEDIARIKTNLAYLLIDVADSFMCDALGELRKHGLELKHDEKRRWNMMLEQCAGARRSMKHAIHAMYHFDETESACEESDRMADMIWLITDRCGTNEDMYSIMRSTIFNQFKSQLGYYGK